MAIILKFWKCCYNTSFRKDKILTLIQIEYIYKWQKLKFTFRRIENIMRERENAGLQYFLFITLYHTITAFINPK